MTTPKAAPTTTREAIARIIFDHIGGDVDWQQYAFQSAYLDCADAILAARPKSDVQSDRETALARAAQDFIGKVDRGEARSSKSYAAFKAALALPSAMRACQVCKEVKPLRCGPSRFGAETWACEACWNPDESSRLTSTLRGGQ